MTLTIIYTGQLAEAAGARSEELDLAPGATLGQALDTLASRHAGAPRFAELLRDEAGKLRTTVLAVIDGTQATGDRENLSLEGASELMFMTPIAGG